MAQTLTEKLCRWMENKAADYYDGAVDEQLGLTKERKRELKKRNRFESSMRIQKDKEDGLYDED